VQDGREGYASGLSFLCFKISTDASEVLEAWFEESKYGALVWPPNIHHVSLSQNNQFICIDYKG
jgi:hypothetical protein